MTTNANSQLVDTSTADSGTVVEDQGHAQNETQVDAINPAWNDILNVIPSSLHPAITPKLKEWDQNFQKVQQDFSPWRDLAKRNLTPDGVNYALQIYDLLSSEEGTRYVYDQMVQEYGERWGLNGQGQKQEASQQPQQTQELALDDSDIANHPKFKELSSNLEAMAQYLLQQENSSKEQQANAQADLELDREITAIKKQYGFDVNGEKLMLGLASQGYSLQEAADLVSNFAKTSGRPNHPNIMPTSGGIPSGQTPDVASLSSKDARQLGVAYLKRLQENN